MDTTAPGPATVEEQTPLRLRRSPWLVLAAAATAEAGSSAMVGCTGPSVEGMLLPSVLVTVVPTSNCMTLPVWS